MEAIIQAITTVGFPVVCALVMGWFIYRIYVNTTTQNAQNMEAVQKRCQERENKLYEEIKLNREVNAKAIETIAHYAEKLEIIQNDVKEIKEDIIVLTRGA